VVLGVATAAQSAFSSRFCGNNSFVTPTSTLYASPEKSSSDLFCAFHPKRVIVPSLRLVLKRPRIPSALFRVAFDASFVLSAPSALASIKPSPNVGVGIRREDCSRC